ncbi:MAG: HAMP domain-containing histidine kinase [Burkholderiales bacterium]|nr:HAMP domain-containing histidine kinase [Opitutaceae bacterium]
MKRVPHLPWVVGLLVLCLAAVPVWAAWAAYRAQAARAGELLFARSAEVVAAQLRLSTARQVAWQNTLRMRLSNRPDAPERAAEELFASELRMSLPEHCRAVGYAAREGERVVLRWIRAAEGVDGDAGAAGGGEVPGLGVDVLARADTEQVLREVRERPARLASVQRGAVLVTALTVAEGSLRQPRGWLIVWWDLDAMCADGSIGSFAADQSLTVRPLDGEARAGEAGLEIGEGGASWRVAVAPGARFTEIFPAVSERAIAWSGGACALLLAGLAGFATHAAGLRAALAAERELVGVKNHLLHSVSHELRTPLSVILSSTELLETYAERLPPERRAAVFAQIREASARMDDMIGQVLLLGRIEARRLPVEAKPVEIAAWMRGLADETSAALGGRCPIEVSVAAELEAGGEGTAEGAGTMTVDPALLRAVLGNALSNAVKFSPAGRPVEFALAREEGVGGRWVFTVCDEGPGIAEADLARVREPFFRAASAAGVAGTGLGLTIADKCAGLLGGRLEILSEAPGGGTTVKLFIPIA